MARHKNKDSDKRTIVMKMETYEKLDKFKAKLIGERGTSNITFDDAINYLLDAEGRKV